MVSLAHLPGMTQDVLVGLIGLRLGAKVSKAKARLEASQGALKTPLRPGQPIRTQEYKRLGSHCRRLLRTRVRASGFELTGDALPVGCGQIQEVPHGRSYFVLVFFPSLALLHPQEFLPSGCICENLFPLCQPQVGLAASQQVSNTIKGQQAGRRPIHIPDQFFVLHVPAARPLGVPGHAAPWIVPRPPLAHGMFPDRGHEGLVPVARNRAGVFLAPFQKLSPVRRLHFFDHEVSEVVQHPNRRLPVVLLRVHSKLAHAVLDVGHDRMPYGTVRTRRDFP